MFTIPAGKKTTTATATQIRALFTPKRIFFIILLFVLALSQIKVLGIQ